MQQRYREAVLSAILSLGFGGTWFTIQTLENFLKTNSNDTPRTWKPTIRKVIDVLQTSNCLNFNDIYGYQTTELLQNLAKTENIPSEEGKHPGLELWNQIEELATSVKKDSTAPRYRRKRRSSTTLVSSPSPKVADAEPLRSAGKMDLISSGVLSSPEAKPKKRVRFSDPGPEVVHIDHSTGLTPAIRRASLKPSVGFASKPRVVTPARRRSLAICVPGTPTTLSSPISGMIQFTPLRQALDDRVQRRLRRNHLSEETNEIDAEKRRERNQVNEMREKMKEKDRRYGELLEELEITRQLGIDIGMQDVEAEDKVRELEDELKKIKVELRAYSNGSAISSDALSFDGRLADGDEDFTMVDNSEFFDANETDIRTSGEVGLDQSFTTVSTLPLTPTTPTTASVQTQASLPDTETEKQIRRMRRTLSSLTADLEKTNSKHERLLSKLSSYGQDKDCATDESALDAALDTVLTSLALTSSRCADAETALRVLNSGITNLGFEGRDAEDMLSSLREELRTARIEIEYLQPGEQVEGLNENAHKVLNLLVSSVKKVVSKLQENESCMQEKEERVRNAERLVKRYSHENLSLTQRLQQVSSRSDKAERRAKEMETQAKSNAVDLERLKAALETYRKEVTSLEELVNRMEAEHASALSSVSAEAEAHRHARLTLQTQTDEAVADLNDQITYNRSALSASEAKASEYQAMVSTLQFKLSEVSAAAERVGQETATLVAEKESSIKSLQVELDSKKSLSAAECSERDELISKLRSEIVLLNSSLERAREEVSILKSSKIDLENRIREESSYGSDAVCRMQAELMRAVARIGDVRTGYLRGSKLRGLQLSQEEDDLVTGDIDADGGMSGPPTPMSIVRFAPLPSKNAEKGGRRRYDSGVGIEEEDEFDEDNRMAEV